MKNTLLFFLSAALLGIFIFTVNAEEPRPSLKQLIKESKSFGPPGSGLSFDPFAVRKHFYGDEAAFRREVAALLETKEDDWEALTIILFLDIGDKTISKILRDKFASSDLWRQDEICNILSRNRSKENLDFLVEVLKRSEELRTDVGYYLSYFQKEYFEGFDAELKNSILNAFISCLDDEIETTERFGHTCKVGDKIAFFLGYFGSFAKPALPKVKEKFISAQDEDYYSAITKLRLAWSIVRIAPEQCDGELEYILKIAMEDKDKDLRWQAISHLDTIPLVLSERVIPCLCKIIQKETSLSNKIWAADAVKAILSEQERHADPLSEEYGEEEDEDAKIK
ncbi:MAG: hypothetical protein FWE67_01130 [Planctomycetaceae bacterium]|nr:hypothetical protein [Planctomycetaceae bacterium]